LPFTQLVCSVQADGRLRRLQGQTLLTPNLLCRIGFCLSLSESGDPRSDEFGESSKRVIRQPVLLGDYEALFVSLLKLRHPEDVESPAELETLFERHMDRGIMLLANRVRNVSDVLKLVPSPPRPS
jgi:DNA sulfur modification protein DndE